MIPSLRFEREEIESGVMRAQSLRAAVENFHEHGCLLLENVFLPGYIRELNAAYVERYQRYFEAREYPDALTVGEGRFMITVDLDEPFCRPSLYANPLVSSIMARCLGADFILGSFGSVASIPGADTQHVHRDFPSLFNVAVDAGLPSFAITVIVPLVDLNAINGTTRLWQGSHRLADEAAARLTPQDPFVPIGGCLLMDYRLRHGGSENRSRQVRPILYNVYYRPWFRDHVNYDKQSPLRISLDALQRVPDELRGMFAIAQAY